MVYFNVSCVAMNVSFLPKKKMYESQKLQVPTCGTFSKVENLGAPKNRSTGAFNRPFTVL